MLTSRNGVDGDVGGGTFVGVSFIGDGNIMDGFQVAGTSASSIGDSLLTFSPLKDAELLRRRARNNSILAKIQELEANASVQAARSERLRMMREEYETLVRKYASARKWNGGLGWNGNNGYHQNAYQPCNSQQQPFISSPSTSTAPPLLLPQQFFSTTLGRSSSSSQPPLTFQPTRDISSNINPTFSTAGVNTDITGPVRPIIMMETGQSEENDLQQWRNEGTFKLKHEKVNFALDSDSQTEQLRPKPASAELHSSTMATTMMMPLSSSTPQPSLVTQPGASTSSAATSFLHDREGVEHNRKMVAVGFEKDEQEYSLQNDGKKNLPAKMEMMMMLEEEEEDDDDESLLQAGRKTMRKQQLQQLHQGRIKPAAAAAALDDNTGSISFTSNSNPTETTLTTTMSKDITEEVPTPRQRQEKKLNGKKLKSKADDSTSGDNTTTSLAPARRKNSAAAADNDDDDNDELPTKNGAGERKGSKYIQFDVSDPSFSDSISVFQSHQRQRKLLLQQLSTSKTSNLKNKGGADDEDKITGRNRNNNESTTTEDEDDDDDNDEERSVIKGSKEKGHNDHDQYLLSPNTTSACGATSESIEDSLMDSIQKTPDTLPKDDSELHGIAEVKDEEEEQEQEEIELDNGNKLPSCDKKDDDENEDEEENWRIPPATAGESSKDERILTQSGVNDKPSDRTGTSLEEAQNGIKELEPNAQINDAKEIRSNNLSSSKLLDVGAEKDENSTFTHANNRVKNDNGSTNQQQQKSEEKKNFDMFYGDVEQPMEEEEANVQSHKGQFGEKLIEQKENEEASNVENKRKSDSQAPSANMSTHSSSITTTSSSSSGLNNATDDVNALQKEDHPNRLNHPKRKSSTGSSSSTSSSRQHSLDELVVGADGGSKGKGQNLSQQDSTSSGSPPKAAPIPTQRSSSTLPQSAQKRHHQLQQQLRKNNLVAKEGTPPVGADNTPEHLSSTISPKSQSPAAATTQSAANTGDDNNATKGTGGAEKVSPTPSQKTTKTSPVTASPSSGRTGDKVGNPNGTNGTTTSTTGNGTGTTSNIRSPKLLKSPILPKTGLTTTSTQNAGRKMRLKLNYDDSESDSSEIAPIKILPTSTTPTGNQADATTNNGSQQQTSIINAVGSSTQQSNAAKKPAEDDEFDDFFDI